MSGIVSSFLSDNSGRYTASSLSCDRILTKASGVDAFVGLFWWTIFEVEDQKIEFCE